jgi:hypothetical protein
MSNLAVQNTSGINISDLTHTGGSIQMQFAALQMLLAQSNKEKAQNYIDDITSSQQKAKEAADMISKARELQVQAKNCDGVSTMPADMVKFFTDNGISIENTGSDALHNKDEWDYNIKSIQNFQETIGSNTQQQMVFVQDFMGQYNSYLTGANSAIQQSNQTLSTIARGQ